MIPVINYNVQDGYSGYPAFLLLRRFLAGIGLWNEQYLAFSISVKGTESPSELEGIIAGVGKVRCDVLEKGKDSEQCQNQDFFEGKAAIVVYDAERLQKVSEWNFRRSRQANPSDYVAMVVMPKVKEELHSA